GLLEIGLSALEGFRARARDVGVEDLHVDAVAVHRAQAALGGVHALGHLLPAHRQGLAVRHRRWAEGHAADRVPGYAVDAPGLAAIAGFRKLRDAVPPSGRGQAAGPRVRLLLAMGIDVDEPV